VIFILNNQAKNEKFYSLVRQYEDLSVDRGIVVGKKLNIREMEFSFSSGLDPIDIPRWLLYWDKIVYTPVLFNGEEDSEEYTLDVKFLKSTEVFDIAPLHLDLGDLVSADRGNMSMAESALKNMPSASIAAQVEFTKSLATNTGKVWSLGQTGGEKLILPGSNTIDLLDIKLVNSLPIPSSEIPFEDILYFKEKHQSELMHLRYTLDTFREKILSSSDERRAIDLSLHEISIALSNIHKALASERILTVSETISLYTKNPELGFWGSIGGIGAASTGLPLEVGATAGLGIPTICKFVKRAVTGGDNTPNLSKDFMYAYEAMKKLK
jgi:hypothetical protein